ncbi:hypothetical protein K458DRAFT_423113 [Lentithecium fluviatile CBS 122367]|uniref:ATP-dependent RNA helicase DHX8 n=1 Tax=Lentithecium fluviatile CBS 122367 TaxID=1168545 RepID=A0A6G1IJJ8_9PLEO|nr:hypothetical protein K458DRAFT_423113 [Lentithecium fluviatile CBS 122367]
MATHTTKGDVTRTPFRQIRAEYDATTITVYQAYSAEIATAAVKAQKLDASPDFSGTRMTWIKPSWAWVLYRSGYSYKDDRQSHILALSLKQETFLSLLSKAILAHASEGIPDGESKRASVRVQWDPERTVRLEKLPYRSIQIGIPGALVQEFMSGIVRIEDVTETARELKKVLDEDVQGKVGAEELIKRGLVPVETEFVVKKNLQKDLAMDVEGS